MRPVRLSWQLHRTPRDESAFAPNLDAIRKTQTDRYCSAIDPTGITVRSG